MTTSSVRRNLADPAELAQVFAKDGTAVTRIVNDETIIIPIHKGAADLDAIYVLNETGSWIWQQMDGRRDTTELLEGMMAEFDISAAQAHVDLDTFLDGLAKEGLIRRAAKDDR